MLVRVLYFLGFSSIALSIGWAHGATQGFLAWGTFALIAAFFELSSRA